MANLAEGRNLYTPEVAALIASGAIPAYNVFPFSGINRDVSDMVARDNASFANNVQAAANGMMAGIPYEVDPSEVLFCGRQIEAARQMEHQQKLPHTPHKTKVMKEDEKLHQQGEEADHCDKASVACHDSDKIGALGKSLSAFIKSEFTLSQPTAKLCTFGPAVAPFAGPVHSQVMLAA